MGIGRCALMARYRNSDTCVAACIAFRPRLTDHRTMQISDFTRDFRTKTTECSCGCWLFSATDRYGYGQFKFRGRNLLAHRFAYERAVGPIPDDMTVDHLCDRHRNCVNPAHFELVSRTENSIRANRRRWDT
jgi:HNH endonuclease